MFRHSQVTVKIVSFVTCLRNFKWIQWVIASVIAVRVKYLLDGSLLLLLNCNAFAFELFGNLFAFVYKKLSRIIYVCVKKNGVVRQKLALVV